MKGIKKRKSFMFSSYTYNTLKYCGIPVPVDIPLEKFSTREREFLDKNKLQHTSFKSRHYSFHTWKNIITINASLRPLKKYIESSSQEEYCPSASTYSYLDLTSIRYVDTIILEYEGLNVIEKLVPFTMKQLKVLVKKNYGVVKGDKRRRQSWVYAYIDTVLLGFNTFAIFSDLNDDLSREIRKFL